MIAVRAIVFSYLLLAAPMAVAATSNLSTSQKASLESWLARNPNFRLAVAADCGCDEDIQQMRRDGPWGSPIPDYEPYLRVGNFRRNRQSSFAVIVIDREKPESPGTLAIFDGPFRRTTQPAFVEQIGKVSGLGLFQTMREGYLLLGIFQSEGCAYKPRRGGYTKDC